MQELYKETLDGYIEIVLKTGEVLTGKIPFNNTMFKDRIVFLDERKHKEFYEIVQERKSIIYREVKNLTKEIPIDLIETYKHKYNTVKNIKLSNNKPTPHWFKIDIEPTGLNGKLKMKYSLPTNHNKWFDLGVLKINDDGDIILPVKFVFLSYAKEDKEIVKETMDLLHDYGILTWFDEKDLLPGDDWQAEIEKSIDAADYVFIFFSSNSIDRDGYKNKEIRYALEQKMRKGLNSRYIIPILVDDVKPPREFKDIHWLKVSDEGWMDKLLRSIGKYPSDLDTNK